MLMIYFTIPDSSFLGHFCGLLAGLLIKFAGIYVLMPRFQWIKEFDDQSAYKIERFGYFSAQPEIETDFNSGMWLYIWESGNRGVSRIRQRVFGYNEIAAPIEPVICPNSIELEDRRASLTRISQSSSDSL